MSKPLLYQNIVDHLLDALRTGELGPGARVPSEAELAARFGVSRVTAQSALELLRRQGVVERLRGKGTFVAQQLPDLDSISLDKTETGTRRDRGAAGRTFALLIPDVSESYGLELLLAVDAACAEHGDDLIVHRTAGDRAAEERAVDRLRERGVDGLIVFPVHGEYHNASLVRAVLDHFPLVMVDRPLEGLPADAVRTDNLAAARELTAALIRDGHRCLAFASPEPSHTTSIEQRLAGFRQAVAEAGPEVTGHAVTEFGATLPGALNAANVRHDAERIGRFLDATPQVTAIVASEYNLARVVETGLRGRPNPPRIACFDSPVDPFDPPRFLHVRQDEAEMGRRAVAALREQLAGRTRPALTTVAFRLVEAGTGPAES